MKKHAFCEKIIIFIRVYQNTTVFVGQTAVFQSFCVLIVGQPHIIFRKRKAAAAVSSLIGMENT